MARLRRRLLAYRAIDFLSTHLPGTTGPDDECLLLVHARQVVGEVRYRLCPTCARGTITAIDIQERFRRSGLDVRALAHLRSRHPGLTWSPPVVAPATDRLRRRPRIWAPAPPAPCRHVSAPA
ncbi:hypothetical protein [Streptomyces sp. NPDC089919]|uniref:hypothetical protein n=1 Tax=Streptomyces sp. NPDC089919 TaxID=3155188 RepID=UPI00343CC7E1